MTESQKEQRKGMMHNVVTMIVPESHSKTSGNNAAILRNVRLCVLSAVEVNNTSSQRKKRKEEKNSSWYCRYRGARERTQWQLVTADGHRECAQVLLLSLSEPLTPLSRTITKPPLF